MSLKTLILASGLPYFDTKKPQNSHFEAKI